MKLGEALTLRARQAQRLNDLQGRIKSSVLVQEGDMPQEDANALLDAYLKESAEHSALVERIAATNAQINPSGVSDGRTLLSLLQERERLIRERNIYRLAAQAANPATDRMYRYSRSEVKFVATVDVADLRTKEEATEQKIREIDALVQRVNWTTELL